MTASQIRAIIVEVIGQILPDEDVSKLKGDVRIRDQVEMDSMEFRKRYGIEVPEEDYMKLATLDSAVAYLEPRMAHL